MTFFKIFDEKVKLKDDFASRFVFFLQLIDKFNKCNNIPTPFMLQMLFDSTLIYETTSTRKSLLMTFFIAGAKSRSPVINTNVPDIPLALSSHAHSVASTASDTSTSFSLFCESRLKVMTLKPLFFNRFHSVSSDGGSDPNR